MSEAPSPLPPDPAQYRACTRASCNEDIDPETRSLSNLADTPTGSKRPNGGFGPADEADEQEASSGPADMAAETAMDPEKAAVRLAERGSEGLAESHHHLADEARAG